jgi:hypothetical protein
MRTVLHMVFLAGFCLAPLLLTGCGHSGPRAADSAPDPGLDAGAATNPPPTAPSKSSKKN